MIEHENDGITGYRKQTNSNGYVPKTNSLQKTKRKHTDSYDTQSNRILVHEDIDLVIVL